jgi:hypothetical protein
MAANQVRKIATIRCLEELEGYETEARKRGMLPEETAAIARRRAEIMKRKANA